MTKTARFKVLGHTKGTNKCHEIDTNDAQTTENIGQLYIQKGAFGTLPVGTIFSVTVEVSVGETSAA
jgi:hypothetical protein